MHMSDSLISPSVGITMCAVSAAAIAFSASKISKDGLFEKKLPLMAVSGAFVFAAQMINFTIPATGSSGHIGGGILLAALLGGCPALLTIAAVLIIQCLFFADGGLLALGCNIFNMGVIPCLVAYPLLFKPFIKKDINTKKITAASVASVTAGLQLGAFAVVMQTLISGITQLSFATFTALMQSIHFAVGIVEGIVTAAILCFIFSMRPEILESATNTNKTNRNISLKKPVIALAAAALITGGVLSIFASSHPDGLEWSTEKTVGTVELEASGKIFDTAKSVQESTAFMPDYEYSFADENGSSTGTSAAGIIGSAMTLVFAGGIGVIITKISKRKKTMKGRN